MSWVEDYKILLKKVLRRKHKNIYKNAIVLEDKGAIEIWDLNTYKIITYYVVG